MESFDDLKQLKKYIVEQSEILRYQTLKNELAKYDLTMTYTAEDIEFSTFYVNTLPMKWDADLVSIRFMPNDFTEEQEELLYDFHYELTLDNPEFFRVKQFAEYFKKNCGIYANPKLAKPLNTGILEVKKFNDFIAGTDFKTKI